MPHSPLAWLGVLRAQLVFFLPSGKAPQDVQHLIDEGRRFRILFLTDSGCSIILK